MLLLSINRFCLAAFVLSLVTATELTAGVQTADAKSAIATEEKPEEQAEDQAEQLQADQAIAADGDAEEKPNPTAKPGKTEEKPPTPAEMAKKLRAEADLYDAQFSHKLLEYKQQLEGELLMLEKNKLDAKVEADRAAQSIAAMTRQRNRLKLEIEIAKLESDFEKQRLEAELAELNAEKRRIDAQLKVEDAKEQLEDRVLGDERYPDQPFQDGVLTISPRRIEFNGPVLTGAADYVCQRLDYFNNQSDKPIFLVIDSSPGGLVSEGLQIVQAIRESKAPVHVVVKRYAASMAASIATLAEHSYCYPNAIILHHQASSMLVGNGRDMEDQKRLFDEVSARLIGQIAEKLGMTEKEFVDQMYANRVSGDWDLFGDQAVQRKWIGQVVELVREESIRERPTGMRDSASGSVHAHHPQPSTGYLERYEAKLVEEIDAQGRAFVRLPRTSPLDAWMIYNPGEYYR